MEDRGVSATGVFSCGGGRRGGRGGRRVFLLSDAGAVLILALVGGGCTSKFCRCTRFPSCWRCRVGASDGIAICPEDDWLILWV